MIKTITVGLLLALGNISQSAEKTEKEVAATEYYNAYLDKCPKDTIRCILFTDGLREANILSINLATSQVEDSYDRYDTTIRGYDSPRKLAHNSAVKLKELLSQMPESTSEKLEDIKAVRVAFWSGETLRIIKVSRSSLPRQIERIYDVAGGIKADLQ